VGSSQGSFVGSRSHTTPHIGLKVPVRGTVEGSSLQADLVGEWVIDRGKQG